MSKEHLRPYTACFTGHRTVPIVKRPVLRERLRETVEGLIKYGYCYFGAGGALGFDTMAAECVLELREIYPKIKLILVLPCRDQASKWSERDVRKYNEILEKCDKVTYVSDYYTDVCMLERNRRLVDGSSVCIAYKTRERGGTAYTVNYAYKCDVEVINLGE